MDARRGPGFPGGRRSRGMGLGNYPFMHPMMRGGMVGRGGGGPLLPPMPPGMFYGRGMMRPDPMGMMGPGMMGPGLMGPGMIWHPMMIMSGGGGGGGGGRWSQDPFFDEFEGDLFDDDWEDEDEDPFVTYMRRMKVCQRHQRRMGGGMMNLGPPMGPMGMRPNGY